MLGLTVLVVEQDPDARARMAAWLEEESFAVAQCGGPLAETFACPVGVAAPCPLAETADLVVLGLPLASDTMQEGPPGWQVLCYYLDARKPVVAIADAGEFANAPSDELLRVVPRPAVRALVMDAVHSVLGLTEPRLVEEETRVGDLAVVRRARAVERLLDARR